jgi:anaerobic ribonucleoside-triphosphate reductase activating protein
MTSPIVKHTSEIANTLNVAAWWSGTSALGPGWRFGLWVQGCPFHCAGCLAPEWIPQVEAQRVMVADLAEMVLSDAQITGLTYSGGEPMLQAGALAELAVRVRRRRPWLDVICFTGYRYEELLAAPPDAGVSALLGQVDLLVDGPYAARLNDDRGLRGSRNQRFIPLSGRLAGIDLASRPRRVEVHLQDGQAFLVGVPPRDFSLAWERAVQRARQGLALPHPAPSSLGDAA